MPGGAIRALVDHLVAAADDIPALVGARPEVDQFLARWLELGGTAPGQHIAQRLYRLDRVRAEARSQCAHPARPRSPGTMRIATALDSDLLVPWSLEFMRECGLGGDEAEVRHGVSVGLERRQRVLWECDGAAVAMAGFGGKTPSGIRISWVYTPPSLRGRGYASALVAALSEQLLAAGNRCCFLYTDLANPTSNGIYRRIGYEPVCDAAHYMFAA
jgi:predicted GNAT family acetyltransferase